MSWDVSIHKPENSPEPLGTIADLRSKVLECWPADPRLAEQIPLELWFTRQCALLQGDGYSIECRFGTQKDFEEARELMALRQRCREEYLGRQAEIYKRRAEQVGPPDPTTPVMRIGMHVRGGGNPVHDLAAFCRKHGYALTDGQTLKEISLDNPDTSTWEHWQAVRDKVDRDLSGE